MKKLKNAEGIGLVREKRETAAQTLGFTARPFVLCGFPIWRPPESQLLFDRRNGLWFSQISKLLINWGLPFFVRFPCSPTLVALAAAFLAFFRQRTVTYSPQKPRPRTQGQAGNVL
ncbi:MAG: hypothetical protein ACK6DY_07650 [Acidobacteriota bacterium]